MSAPTATAAKAAAPKPAARVKTRQQVRLQVGAEGDTFEREADRVADGVLARRPTPITGLRGAGLPRTIRLAPPSVGDALETPGEPLEPALRSGMEKSFGHDFSNVRIHCDAQTDRAVRDLGTEALAVGSDIMLRRDSYAPETPAGRHVLAHELAHVVQHEASPSATPVVMRYGMSFRGFFANLFQFWDYSKDTLDSYLALLDTADRIEDDDDSDDKARQIVAEWKADKARYKLTARLKVLLVREMLSGSVLGADQDAILDLLDGTRSPELAEMFGSVPKPLTFAEIVQHFGTRKARLQLFEQRVLRQLGTLKTPEPGGKSAAERLDELEKMHGIAFRQLSTRVYLAPGNLYSSFAVNLTVPQGGLWATLTLTREKFQIDLTPDLFVDVVWPFSNASLSGFTLTFAGLKPRLDMHGGMEMLTTKAQTKLEEYFQGLLAGTRFAEPGYDPSRDPNLIGEVLDNTLIGDINRVKYNFEKNQERDAGDSKLPQQVSAPAITLDLAHTKGLAPDKGWNVVVEPGTKFRLTIELQASGAQLLKKYARLSRFAIESDGIFIYKDQQKIVGLTGIEMGADMKIHLVGIEAHTDLKEVFKREFPGKFSEYVAGALKKLDNAADRWDAITSLGGLIRPRDPPADSALAVAKFLSEKAFGIAVGWVLHSSWKDIKRTLGVTDEQLNYFFRVDEGRR
jgi:hypothetical protein